MMKLICIVQFLGQQAEITESFITVQYNAEQCVPKGDLTILMVKTLCQKSPENKG